MGKITIGLAVVVLGVVVPLITAQRVPVLKYALGFARGIETAEATLATNSFRKYF